MSEPLLIGWANIHKLFCDSEGRPAISLTRFYAKYGSELQELGIVFKMHIGRGKKPGVCAWAPKIRNWWTLKQKQQWAKKKKKIA